MKNNVITLDFGLTAEQLAKLAESAKIATCEGGSEGWTGWPKRGQSVLCIDYPLALWYITVMES